MVVEDFEDNRVMLEQWLVIQGFRVVHACNGWEAVDVALRERPQLILMDLNLPLLDGTEAACLLRDDVELSEVPIIALTAYDSADARADASDVGFDDYLTKPIDFQRLKQLINSLLSSQ